MSEQILPILMEHPRGAALTGSPQRQIPAPSPSGSSLRFRFLLEPVDNLAPWFEDDKPVLYWHALTYGDLWIDTPLGEVLRYTSEMQREWNRCSPYVDHQIGNLYLELTLLLADALEPVPPDIAAVVCDPDWMRRATDFLDAVWEYEQNRDDDAPDNDDVLYAWDDATQWWHRRGFDTWNCIDGLQFHFWRTGETVSMRWEFIAEKRDRFWALPEGEFSLPVEEFEAAVFGFFDEFLAAMQQRIDALLDACSKDGRHREDCELDLSHLVDAQQIELAAVYSMKGRRATTDWDAVRNGVARYSQMMEKPELHTMLSDALTQ